MVKLAWKTRTFLCRFFFQVRDGCGALLTSFPMKWTSWGWTWFGDHDVTGAVLKQQSSFCTLKHNPGPIITQFYPALNQRKIKQSCG